jgi:hypothetical protein
MVTGWRKVIAVALTAGAAIGGQLAAVAQAQAAQVPGASRPAVSIAVTSRFKPVTHEVFVKFHAGAFTSAAIHGTITGAVAGQVAALYGQEFPYTKRAVRLRSMRLKSARTRYSFAVTPVLATRYSVRLFASGSPRARALATSAAVNLYVISNGFFKGGQAQCGVPVCHETAQLFVIVPPTALGTEAGKRIRSYFGLILGVVNQPPPPKWLDLNGGHARIWRSRRLNDIEFETTISWSFTISFHSFSWAWLVCRLDTESSDGLGLPGHHGCGTGRVLRTVTYLG